MMKNFNIIDGGRKFLFVTFTFLLLPFCMIAHKKDTKSGKVNERLAKVTKVYVHNGKMSRKIVLQFDDRPVVTYTPESVDEAKRDENGLTKMTFFMPHTHADHNNKEALLRLSGMHSKDYGIAFYEIEKPFHGIKCVVLFNSGKVGFEYKTYTSITGDQGIIFEFYDQDVLKNISQLNDVRRHAFNNKGSLFLKKK